MSNPLTELRQSIVEALNAEQLHAYDHIPERVTAPFAYVGPADPYLHYGDDGTPVPFGKILVDHVVVLVAGKGVNAEQIRRLDDMICAALRALDHTPDQVDMPGSVDIAGLGKHYAVAIPHRTLLQFSREEP